MIQVVPVLPFLVVALSTSERVCSAGRVGTRPNWCIALRWGTEKRLVEEDGERKDLRGGPPRKHQWARRLLFSSYLFSMGSFCWTCGMPILFHMASLLGTFWDDCHFLLVVTSVFFEIGSRQMC